tara:strand:+ start:357 stop:818 length:462 start_codon:yes stop_codon:yes gene_type:complete
MNQVSTQKVPAFNISDYSSFNIILSDASDEVRVSPFTANGLEVELRNQLEGLGLVFNKDIPDVIFKISLAIEENERFRSRVVYSRGYYYYNDPFYSFYDDDDRSFIRVTAEDSEGKPLWTGLRSIKYVRTQLVLSEEEINKYIQSFIDELIGS